MKNRWTVLLFAAWLAAPICSASNSGQVAIPAELKTAFEDARYAIDKGLRAENDANGFSIQFSGAETSIDTGGVRVTLALQGYGWGSALHPAGPVTQMEPKGKRLERHYGTALTEWFLNNRQGLEQGFVIAHRAKQAVGALHIRLTATGGWRVDGSGDRARLMKGAVTLDYAGLKAWDSRGAVIPSRLRGSGTRIEIEVDDAGAVYPLSVDPTLTASDAAFSDFFGVSVGLSSDGNTALVGASGKNAQGAAYVFVRFGAVWTQQQKLTVSDAANFDAFGASVGLSSDGNTALMGAPGRNSNQGAAYVFTRSGATWTQLQELTASDAAAGDGFGHSVGLSSDGNTALVGAWFKNSNQGAAYVFTHSGATWTQQQELTESNAVANDVFGYSVALSSDGNTALVGADQKNSNQGAAYVFSRSGAAWTQQQELTASDAAANDKFGYSVGLSSDGNTALVGAYDKNLQRGAAYVFKRSGAAWAQQQKLTASDAANGDFFGWSVGLSGDGNTALVGADNKNFSQGAAYVFTRSGESWTQHQALTASDASTNDFFGSSVGLSSDGNTLLVGTYGKNSAKGAAYVFDTSGAKVGIFRSGFYWLLDVDGDKQFAVPPDRAFAFGGVAGDVPITGDWNGDGTSKVGVYRPANGLFILDYDGDGQFTGADKAYNLGVGVEAGDVPIVGDWNGDGTTKVGLFRQGFFWILDTNGNGVFEQGVDNTYAFGGVAGDIPVVGDWTGDGKTKIGLFRLGFYWILDANGNGSLENINGVGGDQAFAYGGIAGDVPVVGDWNGDGTSKVGVFRQGFFWVLDANGNHSFDGTGSGQDLAFPFGGITGDLPVVGKW